jgi:hypothetical protein
VGTKSLGGAVQLSAPQLTSPGLAFASYRVLVSVQDGLHRGAAFIAASSESVYLGSSPDCDLVLMDDGVHEKALCLFEQDGMLAANVLAVGVWLDAAELPMGVKVFSEPLARLKVGGAVLRVELLRRTRREPALVASPMNSAALPPVVLQRRNWAALTLAGLSMVAALAAVGGAVNASARRDAQQEGRTLTSVIESVNALGAQMVVSSEPGGIPRVRGLVADTSMRERLERDLRAAGLKADVQLHDVRQMGESLTRLALLTDRSCEARHLGGGRFECDAGVADQRVVSQLRALAQQVPGVVALEVRAREPLQASPPNPVANVVVAPEPVPVAAPAPVVARPKLPVIRHVAVGERESFAYDIKGRRLRVGDSVDGAKVVQIRFEGVDFLRDKQRYHVVVTPMLTSASNVSTD